MIFGGCTLRELLLNSDISDTGGFLLRISLAIILGAIIGLERQLTRHNAGIITNIIVCVGAFLFTSFGYLVQGPDTDLTRIAAQVVSGIGFLGAGLIIREGANVRGLNTAATVWTSSAIGILCCLKQLKYAIVAALAIVVVHLVIHPLSDKIDKARKYDKSKKENREKFYKITVVCPEEAALEIRKNIMSIIKSEPNALLHNLETIDGENNESKIKAFITTKTNNDYLIENILTKVGKAEDIIYAGWKTVED